MQHSYLWYHPRGNSINIWIWIMAAKEWCTNQVEIFTFFPPLEEHFDHYVSDWLFHGWLIQFWLNQNSLNLVMIFGLIRFLLYEHISQKLILAESGTSVINEWLSPFMCKNKSPHKIASEKATKCQNCYSKC